MTSSVVHNILSLTGNKRKKNQKRKEPSPSIVLNLRIVRFYLTKMQNEEPTNECSATIETIQSEIVNTHGIAQDPFCSGKCSVCDSGYADIINAARNKFTLRSLSEYLKNEYDLSLDKDALSRHFIKYAEKLRRESVKKAYELFSVESATLAVHQKQTLFLASYTFEEILRRMQNGTLTVGIEEFEKLMKLYYQIMQDPQGAIAPDAMEIYMRAYKMYKVPIYQQSMSFETPPSGAPIVPTS